MDIIVNGYRIGWIAQPGYLYIAKIVSVLSMKCVKNKSLAVLGRQRLEFATCEVSQFLVVLTSISKPHLDIEMLGTK